MNTLSQITSLPPLQSSLSSLDRQSSTSTSDTAGDFQSMLSSMMGSGMMNSGSSGMDAMSMIAPLLITLIEKLIELEMADDKPSASASASSGHGAAPAVVAAQTNSAPANNTPAAGYGSMQPSGRPVGGVLTQGSHAGHVALDFGIPVGTQVKATMDGKVVYSGWNNEGYGNLVIVENGPYRTYYAHLSQLPVSVGQEVKGGSVVGISGNTGNSTGPHLHYEIRKNMVQIDPTSLTL